jgi:phospholipid transport system substrate-binding protein
MRIIKLFLLLGIFLQLAFANDTAYVEQKFQQKIDEVVSIVSDKELQKEERNGRIVKILDPIFDFELMAKISLGQKWRTLSKKDQDRFIELYVERMKKSYSSKLDSYSGEKIEITKIEQLRDDRIVLISNLVASDAAFEVLYKFYKPNGSNPNKHLWLIYDVEIEGVSILKTDRAQFSEYLQQNSIDDLMALLQE